VKDHVTPRLTLPLSGGKGAREGRVLLLGPKAIRFLSRQSAERQLQIAEEVAALKGAAVVVPDSPAPPNVLARSAGRHAIPLIGSGLPVALTRAGIRAFLTEELLAETAVHGVFVDVSGVGVLILGPSGIGKSECALDLVVRGHRLIADDHIIIRRVEEGRLMGWGAEMAGSHMEVRGLGIINIQDLFGVASVLKCKTVELAVDLRRWDSLPITDRLGLDEKHYELLGVRLPYLQIPVSSGRNMAVILEVAARNYLLKKQGWFTAREFDRSLRIRLAASGGAGGEGGGE
jgi:HPr kinase/phosphorylase